MKPCWKDLGLTEKGAAAADKVIDVVVSAERIIELALQHLPMETQGRIIAEAKFRANALPLRSAVYRRKYEKQNYNVKK